MPLAALLALAAAAFITILTEALPAGLLPQMAHSLAVSEALVGQLVTMYAVGSLLAAIPLTALTQRLRKRPLLLAAIAGFAVANTVTCLASNFTLIMAARFLAGVSAGMLWALVAGYAARIAPPGRRGQAIAIAMVGTPLALSLGVPAGTLLGNLIGWRLCFGAITVLAVALIAWARVQLPDVPGQAPGQTLSLARVFQVPGVRAILFVVLAFVLAHNILYTYIAPFLATAGMGQRTDLVLLVFGLASLAGIWIVGLLIDRHLRLLTIASVLLFALSAAMLSLSTAAPVVYAAVAVWGLAFGGSPTLFQTALSHAAGPATDVAQAMLVTGWNLAIAGGGMAGGVLLAHRGAGALSPALLLLLIPTLAVVLASGRHGFRR
ncbi:MAG: MFS transporter [Duganella sp.]